VIVAHHLEGQRGERGIRVRPQLRVRLIRRRQVRDDRIGAAVDPAEAVVVAVVPRRSGQECKLADKRFTKRIGSAVPALNLS
jgi:hypothetical protein